MFVPGSSRVSRLRQARGQLGQISKDQRRQDPALGPNYELQLRSLRERLIDKQAGVPMACCSSSDLLFYSPAEM